MDLVALLNLGRREGKRVYGGEEPAPRRRHEQRAPARPDRQPAVSAKAARTGSSRAH